MPSTVVRKKKIVRRKPKKVPKSVQSYVRRVVRRLPEIKRAIYSQGNNYVKMDPDSFNLAYHMLSRGTSGDNQFIGNKITLKSLLISGSVTNYQSSSIDETVGYHIAVIKTDKYVTSTSLAYNDVFIGTPDLPGMSQFDRQKVKVLAHTQGLLKPSIAGEAQFTQFQLLCHLKNMSWEFSDYTSTYAGKDFNLYIVIMLGNQTGIVGTSIVGGCSWQAQLLYTDA